MTQPKQSAVILQTPKICIISTLLLSLLFAAPLHAENENEEIQETDTEHHEVANESHSHASLLNGYRFISPDGPTASASPYGRLKSGVNGGFSAATLGSDLKLTVDGIFLHEDDYHTELFFDYRGLLRFHAESEALWHNLLREQVTPGTLTLRALDQDLVYGVRTAISQADTRIKLGNNPFHLNLGYWS
jgi:hypothetical protein